ncbi:T9SS C-terminal target domain-containing protein [Sphingobacteriales bacterium UPWRP_1]|nr:hypothetical protein B6N25_03285 [Sphingobacteriales bacterium TSM_CSS]PSJ75017.1 T9SS C-terminal target domain-containing protein [Sphingobacteriales bacterium UPWRP_1]
MKQTLFVALLLLCCPSIFAAGWCKYYAQSFYSYSFVCDLFELNDTVYLSTGYIPNVVFLNALSGDTISTGNSIGAGHAVRTPDGGFMMGMRKVSANFELEWQVLPSQINNIGTIGEVISYTNSTGVWYVYTGQSAFIQFGTSTAEPWPYPCIWSIKNDSTYAPSVTILSTLDETYNWVNGYDASVTYPDNDIVTQIDGDSFMVLANCNTHPCLIPYSYPLTKTCYSVYRLISLIHASDQSGYVMAGSGGGACLLKTNLAGNQQWLKSFTDGIFFNEIFNEVIATTDGGYLAVGQDMYDDIFVVKTDINGNLQWQIKGLGFDGVIPTYWNSTDEMATAVIQTSDGGYLIGGYIDGQYPSSSGEPDPYFTYPFFLKIDSTGNCRPSAGFSHSVAAYNLSITANTSFGADSYLWLFGNGDTSNMAMPAYTYPQPGSYNLCLVARNLCGNDTLCTAIDIATGIGQNAGGAPLQLHLYPNPVRPGTVAYWQANAIAQGNATLLKAYNNLGQLVYSYPISAGTSSIMQGILPVQQWQSGIYLIQLVTATQTLSNKLVLTH